MFKTRPNVARIGVLLWNSWLRRAELLLLLPLILFCWWRLGVGVLEGNPPLISWMVMAEVAVIIMAFLSVQRFIELTGQGKAIQSKVADKIASLILQLLVIIVGNTIIVAMIFNTGVSFQSGDWINFAAGAVGMGLFLILAVLRRMGIKRAWLQALQWRQPWAKCWYTLSLKAFPQAVQCVVIIFGSGRVDFWGVVLLLILGFARLYDASSDWFVNKKVTTARALFTSTVVDFMTIALVFGATLVRL